MKYNLLKNANINAFIKTMNDKGVYEALYRSVISVRDSRKYKLWYSNNRPSNQQMKEQRQTRFEYNPKFSIIVPTYHTPITFLNEMISSVQKQTYDNWELCIADASVSNDEVRKTLERIANEDNRVVVKFLEENKGISENTNEALSLAKGDYIGLLDHDDMLAPNALYEIVKKLNQDKNIDVVYTDEDKIMSGTHIYPHFKPDYNKFLLYSCNYICHFFVFSRALMEKAGYFRSDCDGSQDYDYILRTTNIAKKVSHIPKILYHWRVHEGSVALSPEQKDYCYDAAIKALQDHIDNLGMCGKVVADSNVGFYKIKYKKQNNKKILVVSFSHELSILDNGKETLEYRVVCVDRCDDLFDKIKETEYEYVLFVPNGVANISIKRIEMLMGYMGFEEVYAVSPQLRRKNKIVCMGMTVDNNKLIGCYSNVPSKDIGYYGRCISEQDIPFLSPGCFITKKEYVVDFLSKNKMNKETSTTEFSVLFSLYIHGNNKQIVGTPRVFFSYKGENIYSIRDSIMIENKKDIEEMSKLYVVPKWYR